MEKYNLDELNFPWEKNCFTFFSLFTTLRLQQLELTAQFEKSEAITRTQSLF